MMETIDIYNRDGVLKVTVQPLPRSVYKSELMVGDTVTLCYNSPEFTLEAGDYVLYNEEKFKIITLASPQRTSTGYQIEQVFAAEWMEWGHRILFFDRGKSKEKAWSMTHKIEYFADIVVSNIKNAGLGEYVCSFSAGLGDSKFLQFDGTDIITALNMIAEAWQTEWRVTGANIVFGKCEYGSRVVTLTEGKEIASITKAETTSGNAVTRLYAFGSDKNLPSSYRADDKDVVSAVVARNLHLPEGVDYIDLRPDMAQEEIVEGTAIFEDVYPRRIGKISVVYSEDHVETDEATKKETKWTVYRFTDEGLDFREKYIIPGQELHIIFQTGKLAGMDFAVIFNPGRYEESERDAQRFEIVRNETYGAKIPNATLKPSPGDTYVMYGYDTSFVGDTLVGEAEQELLIRARQWLEEENKDATTYECVMNEIRCKGYEEVEGELTFDIDKVIDLYVGAPVLLRSSLYGDRESRVRAVGVRLDGKGRTYTIGKSARYSRLDSLSSKVDEIQYASSNMSGHGSVYVIGSNDQTPASDKNVYSAKRTDKQIAGLDSKYLRKDIDDTAQGHITFNDGLTANATAHLQGGSTFGDGKASIDPQGNAILNTLQSIDFDELAQIGYSLSRRSDGKFKMSLTDLEVWGKAIFNTLQIRELSYVGGNIVLSPAASKITYAREMRDGEGNVTGWKCYLLADDGSTATFNSWKVNDQVRCKTFNIEEGVHENVSNKDYWRMVTDVSTYNEHIVNDDGYELFNGNLFAWIVIAKGNCMENSDIPSAGDTIVLMGNKTDTERQHLLLMETEGENAPRIVMYRGVNSYSLKDKNIFSVGRNGVDIVSQYFNFITASGDKVYTPNYRGNWTEGTEYYYYDEVSWMGTRWLCLVGDRDAEGNKMSTTSEPSSTNAFWQATTAILSPRLNLHHNLSAGIAKGETHTVRCSMTLGDTDITVAVSKWAVSRNTGNEADDLAWSFKDKVQNFRGEIAITWSNDNTEDDIGRGDVAEFTFSAVTSTGDIYKKVLAV